MATGITTSNGAYSNDDLDTLFKARTSTKAADVGYDSNGGVDISNRFEPIGATTKIADTGYVTNEGSWTGQDLADIFMDINAAIIGADWPWAGTRVDHDTFDPVPAIAGLQFNTDGTFQTVGDTLGSGDFLETTGVGAANDIYIKFANTGGSAVNYTIGGVNTSTYTAITTAQTIAMRQLSVGNRTGSVTIYLAYDAAGTGAVSWSGTFDAVMSA